MTQLIAGFAVEVTADATIADQEQCADNYATDLLRCRFTKRERDDGTNGKYP